MLLRRNAGKEHRATLERLMRRLVGEPGEGTWHLLSLEDYDAISPSLVGSVRVSYTPVVIDGLTRYRDISRVEADEVLSAFTESLPQQAAAYVTGSDSEIVGVLRLPVSVLSGVLFDLEALGWFGPDVWASDGTWRFDLQRGYDPATYEVDTWRRPVQRPG